LDLNTISEIVATPDFSSIPQWQDGDAWLGGGTWQTSLKRLFDLDALGWTPIEVSASTLSIAATCKIRELKDWPRPHDWSAGHLIDQCCDALLGSFKIWNMATVGGNICLSLPAGPMTSLAAALGATCIIWMPDGAARVVPASDFVVGNRQNVLQAGELLRSIQIPLSALHSRAAFRQVSLTPRGRSAALLIGTTNSSDEFVLTITASTVRPVRIEFRWIPSQSELRSAIDQAVPDSLYHDDIHGRPDWRRHLTHNLSAEILRELAGDTAP
jgi:CO/xanthine dehydrogenase FAD-binding subunit